MDRRDALRLLAATITVPFAATAAACSRTAQGTMASSDSSGSSSTSSIGTSADAKRTTSTGSTMPVVFIAHGAPPLLDDASWQVELAAWARAMPWPKAILSLSAHWENHPIAIGAITTVPLVYDFYGFPERYYKLQYAAPGAPLVAARIRELLREKNIAFVLAHPREEHLAPVIAAAAAAIDRGGDVTFPITGFWNLAPAFTRRTVQIG